jgi:hypothetical protein
VKLGSSSTECYTVSKAELLRKLGILVNAAHDGERVDIALDLTDQGTLTVRVSRNRNETELPEQSHPRMTDIGAEPTVGLRKNHLLDCPPWCQHPHPNLGGYQPGPVARQVHPRDHSLEQNGPGDPV